MVSKYLSSVGVELGLVEELEESCDDSKDEAGDENVEYTGNIRQLQTARRLLLSANITRYTCADIK